MRRVASSLSVTPMSLYNHVSDKAELIDLMVDFIVGDIIEEPIDAESDWVEALRTVCRQTHKVWGAHPGFARVYSDGVTVGPNGLTNIERTVKVLRDVGFSDADAARAFFLLYQYTISSLLVAHAKPLDLHARDRRSDGSADDRVDTYFSALPRQDVPNVLAVARFLSGGDFEFGLDILLNGLRLRLQRSPSNFP